MIALLDDKECLAHVVRNMRAFDFLEIYATQWSDEPEDIIERVWQLKDFVWLCRADDGEPVAIVGGVAKWPGHWSVFAFATDRFSEVGLQVTRFIKRIMIPSLVETGVHRADCYSLESHEDAHKWLSSLGAKRHSEPLVQWGRNRENFVLYYWLADDV